MSTERELSISVHVTVNSDGDAARVAETLHRVAVGFGIEGFGTSMVIGEYDRDDETEPVQSRPPDCAA